jgi:hypothetical protein
MIYFFDKDLSDMINIYAAGVISTLDWLKNSQKYNNN